MIKLRIKRPYGELEISGKNLEEVTEALKTFPDWLSVIDNLVAPQLTPVIESSLSGIVEFTADGPSLIVPREKIIDREAIGLLLYATDPQAQEPKEIGRLLSISGRASTGFFARLNELRQEGKVVKEGKSYKLTSIGKKWVEEELIPRIKG